uniref:Uncharacterized protein n=1 Tax=Guillardia theta TaxID=55529 RepID=A0A7S4PBH9_GUITH
MICSGFLGRELMNQQCTMTSQLDPSVSNNLETSSLKLLGLGEQHMLLDNGVILSKSELLRSPPGVLPGEIEVPCSSLAHQLDKNTLLLRHDSSVPPLLSFKPGSST